MPISGNITHLILPRKMLVSTLKQLNKYKHSVNSVFVEFLKRHEMKKLELCIILPAVKMLNPILSSNLLEYLKTVKLKSTLRKLYRNYLTNLQGTVSSISTNNRELLDQSSNNFPPIHASIGRM